MYRSYTRALADEMRRRSLAASAARGRRGRRRAAGAAQVRRCARRAPRPRPAARRRVAGFRRTRSGRRRSTRIPRCACGPSSSSPPAGTRRPPRRPPRSPPTSPHSADPADRRAAASALGPRRIVTDGQSMLIALLDDADPTVRAAALDAVVPEDAGEPEVVRRVVAALEEPRTAGSATAAVRRLGDAAVPLLAAALARDGASRRPPLIRAAANAATEHGLAVIEPALRDPRPRGRARGARRARRGGRRRRRPAGPPRRGVRRRRRARSPRARRPCVARALPTGRCEERWRTRATSHGDSSSPCSRFATAIECGTPFGSWTARTASAAHSESRRSTCSSRGRRPRSPLPLVRRDLTPDEQAAALQHGGPSARSPRRLDRRHGGRSGRTSGAPLARLCARHAIGR